MNIRAIYISITILILSVGKSFAQDSDSLFQIAYENALLDSAYRYELLKPTLYSLQNAYTHQGKQVQDLKIALHLSELQIGLREKELRESRRDNKKRARKSWFKGALQGVIIGAAAGIFLIK